MNASAKEAECCPEFHPEKWDKKTFTWEEKPFLKESIPQLFHIPFIPMIGKKISKMMQLAERAKVVPENREEVLLLFNDPHPFQSDIYLSVTGPAEQANNVTLSGMFVSRVFDGPYNSIPKHLKEMSDFLSVEGKKAKTYYVHYAYCPGCSKKFGHNYMILFAEL